MLRFLRHLVEMLLAMGVGMAVLGIGLMVVGEPPGYDRPLVTYGAMGVAMAVPMIAWMRYRGHFWSDGGQMTAAMLVRRDQYTQGHHRHSVPQPDSAVG